jgi:hypothetical protein
VIAIAFKVVEGRNAKGTPIVYLYGRKYMGSLFCADQAEADALLSALHDGCYEQGITLEASTFEQTERTS